MPELTRAAEDLRRVGEQLHRDLRRRTLPLWATLATVALLGVVGWFYVNDRVDRNAAKLRVSIQADCDWYRDVASAPVLPSTQELGRRLVRNAAQAYEQRCAADFGGLNGKVDPDAFRPAPPPPPTPAPTGR